MVPYTERGLWGVGGGGKRADRVSQKRGEGFGGIASSESRGVVPRDAR